MRRPVTKHTLWRSIFPLNLTLMHHVVVILCCLVSLPCVRSGCLSTDGVPICCRGKQSACYGYTFSKTTTTSSYPSTRWSQSTSLLTPDRKVALTRCFCDDHCTTTNDCCADYRTICSKPKVDCMVSEWGPWTKCSRMCGKGYQERRRTIARRPQNGGNICPVLEERRSCEGSVCPTRRVGRSGALMAPYLGRTKAEVAHLLPVRGDVLRLTQRFQMRWDVRRKLYLGRLIKMNETEQPEPDPYCAIYEVTQTTSTCESRSPVWPFARRYRHRRQVSYSANGYPTYFNSNPWVTLNRNPYYTSHTGRPTSDLEVEYSWKSHLRLLTPRQQICVTCYPAYMREDLGYRCSGTGLPGVETRWRALRTNDCQGRFKMIGLPRPSCNCGRGAPSFVFV